jgi:hypothetical protein
LKRLWLVCCSDAEDEELTAEKRFRRVQEAMRMRDAADRAAQKAMRREKKLAKKERACAAATGGESAAGACLAAPSAGDSGMPEGGDSNFSK